MAAHAPRIERRSIDAIPAAERQGTPANQFTLWLGANLQITAVVDGALAVVFGAHALWAIVGLLLGNVLGGAVMALHSAQGPRLGLPQMISSRAQFGVFGAVVPLVLVIVMYLGFTATGTVLSGQAINAFLGVDAPAVGICLFIALVAVIAIVGHDLIHSVGRVASVLGIIGFGYLAVRLFTQHDVGAAFAHPTFDFATFLLAVSLGAGWQLTYGPYVADYSRYLPADTPPRHTFWGTFAGSVLGSQVSMTFGAVVAAVAGDAFLSGQVAWLGDLAGPAAVAALIYLLIVVGKLTVTCLNAYGSFMCAATSVTAFTGQRRMGQGARAAFIVVMLLASMAIALWASADFLSNFKNFVLLLLMVFTPWSAINLTDYYLVSKEKVDLPALYDPEGRYGRWNAAALVTYAVGIVVQVPFLAQTLYTGPVTKALGGADISWLVGLAVPALVYYVWAGRQHRAPEQMIGFPEVAALDGADGTAEPAGSR
ncbi:purine-cytosine permease family protein [Nocardioides panaciterrulae]|uniref:NCS1 family nucleobase:cation symporter-1 n=1 Tax=Nocardioides panaciterrulae TaxID=661492 RepID=A0A7Y9JA97_9ACTN|nr:cytosine permease [Nocardioides panaciterrulae]NYD41452.1 NCS1 family nucleobase:cation symporter-1 [Nocardioides panaciterrulae]